MLFHQEKTNFWKKTNFDVKIGITVVKKVDNYKYLCVNLGVIDSNINWSEHVETIKTKLIKNKWCYI